MKISQFFKKKNSQDDSQHEYAENVLWEKLQKDPNAMAQNMELPSGCKYDSKESKKGTFIFDIKYDGAPLYTATIHYFLDPDTMEIHNIRRLKAIPKDIPEECHIGSRILDRIAGMAEECGFKYVVLDAVAMNIVEGALDQEQLEKWYTDHLKNKSFKYFIKGFDEFYEHINKED